MSKVNYAKEFQPNDLSSCRDDHIKNRIIFDWLCDDTNRAKFFAEVRTAHSGVLEIESRTKFQDDPAPLKSDRSAASGSKVYLVTSRELINEVLKDTNSFGNLPYSAIGSGSFLLGLDPGVGPNGEPDIHDRQRAVLKKILPPRNCSVLPKLCHLAVQEASIMALRSKNFDAAEFAEQAAIRYCIKLFGFAPSDYALLEESLRRAYRAMNYQMLGRHFLSEPLTLPIAREWMGRLATRCANLIDEYQRLPRYPRWEKRPGDPRDDQRMLPEGVESLSSLGLTGLEPLLKQLGVGNFPGVTGEERAVIAVGTLAGMVGNIQASISIALEYLLKDPHKLVAYKTSKDLWPEIAIALKANPPAPFLPRIVRKNHVGSLGKHSLPEDTELILAVGGGTNDGGCPYHQGSKPTKANEDSLIFGYEPESPHWCIGNYLARPLISEFVKQVINLPSIARRLDPVTAEVMPLEKRWGFACEQFPLTYKKETLRAHQVLNVVMRIKAPIAENAERLKRVIRDGAPRIERELTRAAHVHFAWFEMIENDTKLVLHTLYDGDFEAYVQHFALNVDDMFDQLFMSVEGSPPLPVRDFPNEFVDTIRRFNQPALAGYLFSAYPTIETQQIIKASRGGKL